MNAGNAQDPEPKMRLDDNDPQDPLWNLLAQSPRPEPDAWFAARTLARCRNEGLGGEVIGSDERISARIFVRIWRWALGGGLAVAMAVALLIASGNQQQQEAVAPQPNVQDAFEIVASLDSDSDSSSSSSSSWQDSSL